jgi:hypothetical protein
MALLKAVTYWVRPTSDDDLPESAHLLEGIFEAFYQVFPEYDQTLKFSQFARRPHFVFVYVTGDCNGLLPEAGTYLRELLESAFPSAEVRVYGKSYFLTPKP